jgi:hypothetical protein
VKFSVIVDGGLGILNITSILDIPIIAQQSSQFQAILPEYILRKAGNKPARIRFPGYLHLESKS